jgi:hypothetical protein
MPCIGYAKSVPDEGFLSIVRPQPLTRLEFAELIRATLSHKGREEFLIVTLSLLSSIGY